MTAMGCACWRSGLERGSFVWPQANSGTVSLTRAQLSMLLEGIICRDKRTRRSRKKGCVRNGRALRKLGEEVPEMLEYVPASFVVIRHVRPKLSCTKCDCIVQAEAPSRPIERGVAAPGLWLMCWCRSTAIISCCIASRRCMRVRMWSRNARLWPTGWAARAGCWSRWGKRCAAT
jgi:transposase